ncbi:pectin lyase-like superfamily protein [Actinidia rufa]|uniref:Pectin lyase-like superfamily protein n=1 Tax=Actinidia rufa TaxID=165716 RepID=A0A7J0DQ75_9ERIC|nr:pectin lyase-like superfamily protein [Actinidia rufa]
METTMARRFLMLFITIALATLIVNVRGYGKSSSVGEFSGGNYPDVMRKLKAFKVSFLRHDSISLPPTSMSPSPGPSPSVRPSPRVYEVTSYGADPTGKTDSTEAILRAISDAFDVAGGSSSSDGLFLMEGIVNLGGAHINLEGGTYTISRPLRLPSTGRANFRITGGTLKASDNFPVDGYLIDLSASYDNGNEYNYEYITLRDLMLDSNFRGGGIQVVNSLRTSIDNCYIAHFTSNGILVHGGHETYIRNSFLGQHITAGGDYHERNFSATGINLMGNDNAITDVVIFSAAIGIMVSGQANTISGVHCYNKATGFGGTGIYLKLPGLTQTRIVNSYLDYTGIVAEDPVQLHISSCFFLGDAYIVLKSINGVINGVNIIDNMFSGSGKGTDIVHLDQTIGPFTNVDQVVVDRNNVKGMKIKATVARRWVQGNGSSWTVDFNLALLFPNRINIVQYALSTTGSSIFPNHALRNVTNNRIVIESDVAVPASVFVMVDQGVSSQS